MQPEVSNKLTKIIFRETGHSTVGKIALQFLCFSLKSKFIILPNSLETMLLFLYAMKPTVNSYICHSFSRTLHSIAGCTLILDYVISGIVSV